jgi:hypothetical protein
LAGGLWLVLSEIIILALAEFLLTIII